MRGLLLTILAVILPVVTASHAEARGSGSYYSDGGSRCHCRNFSGDGRTDPMLRYIHSHRSRTPRY